MRRTWAISGWGWLLCGLLVVAAGCQTFNVRTDWDEETAFGRFQRYAWVEPPEVEGASPSRTTISSASDSAPRSSGSSPSAAIAPSPTAPRPTSSSPTA
ncbi:MAG: hypothetical protein R3E53_09730 [Myxococcota bacterium]